MPLWSPICATRDAKRQTIISSSQWLREPFYYHPRCFFAGPGEIGKFVAYPALDMSLPVTLWAVCLGIMSIGLSYFGI